jgi:hypothetical protein
VNVIQLANAHDTEGPALIGSRWRPGHVIRRDTELGTFESVNPPLETMTEALVQRALLAKAKPSLVQRFRNYFFLDTRLIR